jgi:hypothetical protein
MKKLTLLMIPVALAFVGLSSCHKDFDPKSYAPPLVINGFSSTNAVAKDALVAHYAFDGNLIDSVSGTAGVATGTSFSGGVVKQALQGAANSYVLATPSAAVKSLSSFTIDEWVNTAPPGPGIIGIFTLANTTSFWGNIEMFYQNGSTNAAGQFQMHLANATKDGFYVVNNVQNLFDKPVNIAVTYNAADGTCQLFVNGSKVNSGPSGITGPLDFQNVGKLVFGCVQFETSPSLTSATDSQPWAYYNLGTTDEVRIYNKVLSSSEIGAIVALEGRGK